MTDRERLIIKTTLQQLKAMRSAGPVHEAVLLNAVSLQVPKLMKSEFEDGLRTCESALWVIGVPGILDTRKWSMSDAGAVALIEMS